MPKRPDQKQTNEQRVLFWNCGSGVFNKKPFLEKYISDFKPLLFFVSECNIRPCHWVEALNIQGYEVEVCDTLNTRKLGRVLAYVKSGEGFKRLRSLEDAGNDIIVLQRKSTTYVGIYAGFKLHENETLTANYERLLDNLQKVCNKKNCVLIGGDFNSDPSRENPRARRLELWQLDNGLDQLVRDTTRMRAVAGKLQQSLIDHIYVRDCAAKVEAVPSCVSDHFIINVNLGTETLDDSVTFEKHVVTDWRNFNPEKFKNTVQRLLDNHGVFPVLPDPLNRELTTILTTAMNASIPKRVVHKRRGNDIINYHIEAVKKKRDRLIKKARKRNCEETMQKVRELNVTIKKIIKRERNRILHAKIKDSSPQTFWHTVNSLLGKNVGFDEIQLRNENGTLAGDEMAECFAHFFRNKVEKLVLKNPVVDHHDTLRDYVKTKDFSAQELDVAISSFKAKKSCGPDEIPMVVLKSCFESIRPLVLDLFNKIVSEGRIPVVWKMARIKPIHKKGDKSQVENFRPISNLNSLSKVFERCILNRLSQYNDIDGLNQHGFRPNHSTVTAALHLQTALAEELDKNRMCIVYSMDLSAAFDLIRPGMFVKKALEVIPDSGLVWLMRDFITDRRAYVEVGANASTTFKLPVGCPQGSTLGPKVFSIYCHDLVKHVPGTLITYADDSYVMVSATTQEDLLVKAKTAIECHLKWLAENGMVCNVDKTEILAVNCPKVSVNVSGHMIESKSEMKVLGVVFDDKLSWEAQVTNTVKRSNRVLHGLRLIRKHFKLKEAKQIVTSFYYSILYYAIQVWYHKHLAFHLKQKVRSCHYRALRLLHGQNYSRQDLDDISERANPDEYADYVLAKTAAKITIAKEPLVLHDIITSNSYTERRKEGRLLFFDASVKKIGKQSFRNRLQNVSKKMNFKWLECSVPSLRNRLKDCFFHYIKKKKSLQVQ